MNFPRHWSFAKSGRGQAWGWSDVSLAAAQAAARERAAKVDALLRGSSRPDRAAEYYPGQPMREPVLRELAGPDGGLAAVVTRNTYGADILNAADALFVDVDLPEPAQPGLLARLFGAKAPPPGQPSPAESAALARAEAWANRLAGLLPRAADPEALARRPARGATALALGGGRHRTGFRRLGARVPPSCPELCDVYARPDHRYHRDPSGPARARRLA